MPDRDPQLRDFVTTPGGKMEPAVDRLMAEQMTRCSECGRKLNPNPSHPGRNGHLRTCSRTGNAADAR